MNSEQIQMDQVFLNTAFNEANSSIENKIRLAKCAGVGRMMRGSSFFFITTFSLSVPNYVFQAARQTAPRPFDNYLR